VPRVCEFDGYAVCPIRPIMAIIRSDEHFICHAIYDPVGSNDLLAYRAAEELLRPGHRVLMSPWDWGDRSASEYEQIQKKGALWQ
jgi:hypothetical protein